MKTICLNHSRYRNGIALGRQKLAENERQRFDATASNLGRPYRLTAPASNFSLKIDKQHRYDGAWMILDERAGARSITVCFWN
jgi:hypothetical protein